MKTGLMGDDFRRRYDDGPPCACGHVMHASRSCPAFDCPCMNARPVDEAIAWDNLFRALHEEGR